MIRVALQKADVDVASAVMVGDSVWDIEAAGTAGISAIGLRSGGTGEDDLRAAGAVAVFADASQLLEEVAVSPLAALWSGSEVGS